MNQRILSCLRPCAILSAIALIGTGGLHAASLTWDASGTTPAAPTGGPGTWSSANLNWSNGTVDAGWNNANGDSAIFAGTGGTVTLGEAITVNNLNINSTGYTIAGSSFLTVTGTITNTQTTTISARLTGGDLNKAGSGNLVLNSSTANTYTGATNILAGVIQTRATGALATTTNVAISSTATLDLRASQTVAGLSGTGTVNQSQTAGTTTLTINPDGATVAADSTFGGVLKNGDATHLLALTKTGSRTLTLTGDNTYTGNTTVTGGTLQIGAANRIADTSNLVLSTGTFATGGFSETLGTLTVSLGVSYIDLGNGASALAFADSSAATWGASVTLNILNYDAATDSIRFGSSASGLTTAQLAQIRVNGAAAIIDANGYLGASAVPEPSTYAILAGSTGLAAALYLRRRRAR